MTEPSVRIIRTPDQRLRVFVSSTLQELADERQAAREAITHLRLAPVMFELGARPHPPKDLYRAYLDQSHIFIGIYWQKYDWVAPEMTISGLEDEYNLSGDKPKLIYIKKLPEPVEGSPAPDREPRLNGLLDRVRQDDQVSYKPFSTPAELRELIENDLAMLLTERFEATFTVESTQSEPALHPHHNISVPLTRLIGRETELAALHDLLRRDDAGLITLTGPGGIGKTRLALQAALDGLVHFEDGVCFVSLASIRDDQLVVSALATTLGVRESRGGPPIFEGVKTNLRDKHILLLLDNFEQVIAAAPLVAQLLEVCPRLKILVTSRTPLHLRGEKEYLVLPLAVPDHTQLPDLDQLARFAAVELFVERARETAPDFALTTRNAPVIAEICQRLDGLPLAIELAAARIKIFTPRSMLARLDRRLPLLIGGARDLPARQQTLRNTIDWSYRLLGATEQRLFAYLAVFVGGCTLEAAEAVCHTAGDLNVFDSLSALVDNSLLESRTDVGAEPRFTMLETIREYALECLDASGEADRLRQQHAQYFLTLAERAEPQLRSSGQPAALERIETEYDNLRAVVKWALTHGEYETVARIGWALWYFWWIRGYQTEGCRWLEEALTDHWKTMSPSVLVRALYALGAMFYIQGDYARAVARREEILALARKIGDRPNEALILVGQGLVAMYQNNVAEATTLFEQGLRLYRELNDHWGIAYALQSLGRLAVSLGDGDKAIQVLSESVARFREIGENSGLIFALHILAMALLLQDEYDRASTLLKDALTLAVEIKQKAFTAYCLEGLASAAAMQHQAARAAQLWGAAAALRETIGTPLTPTERSAYEPYLAATQAQLDKAAFEAAYVEGRALKMESATALALDKVDHA